MKIVFLTASFYPSIGGVETHTYQLAGELVRKHHKLTVITEQAQPKDLGLAKIYHSELMSASEAKSEKSDVESVQANSYFNRKLRVYRFYFGKPGRLKKFKIWWTIFKYRDLIREADVVHCHDVFIWYLPFRFLYPGKKVFTTFHGYETKVPPEKKAVLIRKISEKLSRGTVCVGDFIKNWYGTKPDMVTYGGVDRATLRSGRLVTDRVHHKKLKIVLVGRLADDIGIPLYIKVLALLKKKKIPFILDVYGDGEYKFSLRRFGRVQSFSSHLYPVLRRADIVFASSYLIMLEALVLGKPIYAVYSNKLKKDYLLDSPFKKYVTMSDSAQDVVRSIIREPNQKVLEDGKAWAQEQTWEKVADEYAKLWEK